VNQNKTQGYRIDHWVAKFHVSEAAPRIAPKRATQGDSQTLATCPPLAPPAVLPLELAPRRIPRGWQGRRWRGSTLSPTSFSLAASGGSRLFFHVVQDSGGQVVVPVGSLPVYDRWHGEFRSGTGDRLEGVREVVGGGCTGWRAVEALGSL
jgi:hypothetical protein